MKLRLFDNSIRIRLTRPEVDQLARKGSVFAATVIAPGEDGSFSYGVVVDREAESIDVRFQGSGLEIRLPESWAESWAGSSRVGFESTIDLGSERTLEVIVEKDFQRLKDRRRQEGSGTYPNPRKGARE